jgi:hypothetical protein
MVKRKSHGVTNMFILEPFALPFIYLFKWLAELCLLLSNLLFASYSALLGWSMKLNDIVEASIWPRD